MTKLFVLIGSTLGGYVGWWAGERAGLMTAFMLSMVGTAAGVYGGRRVAQHYET
jgi:predicted esterase YcpF (UPF0227 family)